jgi:hypothetical protein
VEGATSIPRGYARAERNGLGVLETTSQDEIS